MSCSNAHIGTGAVSRADWSLCRQSASSHKELRHAAALLKAAAGVRITGLPEDGGADLSGRAAPETAWHYPNLAFDGEQHRDALMALAHSFETGKPQRSLTLSPASPVLPLVDGSAQSLHACPVAKAWRLRPAGRLVRHRVLRHTQYIQARLLSE